MRLKMLNPFQSHLINRFVFIDCENGNVANTETVATFLNNNKSKYLTDETTIFCFFGKNKTLGSWKKGISEKISDISNFEFIDTNVNADMVIAAYFGGLCKNYPKAEFIIIAYDRDYSPLVSYFSSLKIKISQEKICSKNIKKQIQTPSEKKAKRGQPVKLEEAFKKITKLERNQRPKKKKGIRNYINFNFISSDLDSDTDKLIKKLKTEKFIEINDTKITWKK